MGMPADEEQDTGIPKSVKEQELAVGEAVGHQAGEAVKTPVDAVSWV